MPKKRFCLDCSKLISATSTRCNSCNAIKRRKLDPNTFMPTPKQTGPTKEFIEFLKLDAYWQVNAPKGKHKYPLNIGYAK